MGFLGMKMLLGWGPMKSQEKKEKKKRADLNIMCDKTKQYMQLIATFINVEVRICFSSVQSLSRVRLFATP